MQNAFTPSALRRSSRVLTALPILVTGTAEKTQFSEVCKTLVVNAHGCAVLSPVKFETGVPLRFRSKDGRETTARVVSCDPMGPGGNTWRLGAKLDRPENFWGISNHPADWVLPIEPLAAQATSPKVQTSIPPEVMLDLVARRLEAPLRRMISESINPLQAEVAAIKETFARREANPSRFEVSLSQIPPQLEQQLEQRLKKDLGAIVSQESRKQYADLLEAAKSEVAQRTRAGYEEFCGRASEKLKAVEQRAQEISTQISASAQERLRRGSQEFEQQLIDGGNSLKRLSQELLEFLQQSLTDQHTASCHELEQVRSSVASDSSRLRMDVEALDTRIARLNDSVRTLESGLDTRLSQMAANTVRDTRTNLEMMANEALEQLAAHSSKALSDQLDQTSERIIGVQKNAVETLTDSLKAQLTKAEKTFESSTDQIARLSVDEWKRKLATELNALARNLGKSFEAESESGGSSETD